MSVAGLPILDKSAPVTNMWLNEIMADMGRRGVSTADQMKHLAQIFGRGSRDIKALIDTKKFHADGLISESNPGDQKAATCFLVAQIKGGKYVRLFPDSGYSCDGAQYVPYNGS